MTITVTKWNLDNISSLEEAKCILVEDKIQEIEVDWDDDPLKYEFIQVGEKTINEILTNLIESDSYKYLIFKGRAERSKSKKSWYDEYENLKERNERINILEATFILYETEHGISMISIGSATTVSRVINYLFRTSKWGDITKHKFNINEDLYYWLLYRLKDEENHNLIPNGDLKITGLLSYLGKTEDGNNAVRGNGRRVLSILGTLAYIVSSDSINALRPELQFKSLVFVTELTMNDSFKVYEDHCICLNHINKQERIVALSMYTIERIIPRLISSYIYSKRENLWTKHIKDEFLRSIGREIIGVISHRMNNLDEGSNDTEVNNSNSILDEIEDDLLEEDLAR